MNEIGVALVWCAAAADGVPDLRSSPDGPVADRIKDPPGQAGELPATVTWAPVGSERPRWPGVLAVVFLLGVAAGLLRLLAGLAGVRSCRLRSEQLSDLAIVELVNELRVELSCGSSIEVRESKIMVTAATFGWRRPLILLPAEWTTWTEPQRRAVLAHEISHVCHNDFLACLCGQLWPNPAFLQPPGALAGRQIAIRAGTGRRRGRFRCGRRAETVSEDIGRAGSAPGGSPTGMGGLYFSTNPGNFLEENRNATTLQTAYDFHFSKHTHVHSGYAGAVRVDGRRPP